MNHVLIQLLAVLAKRTYHVAAVAAIDAELTRLKTGRRPR